MSTRSGAPCGELPHDPASRDHRERRVWQLAGLLALAAAGLAAPILAADPDAAVPVRTWAMLVPVFAAAEILVVHLPSRRSSHSHTLREIPAILGLTFLAPQQYLTAYLLGSALALVLWTRLRGVKLGLNLAMLALEAALGATVYHLLLGGQDPSGPGAWLAVGCAVLSTDLVSATAVTLAISLTEGAFDGQVLKEALRSGVPAALVNSCVALLGVTLVVARPSALPLLGVAVLLLVLGYRVYVGLARGYARLELLYRFVGTAGRAAELDEVVPAVLSEAAGLLQAARAQLAELSPDGRPLHLWTWEDGVLRDAPLASGAAYGAWWSAACEGRLVALTASGGAPAGAQGVRDGLAVPLREGGTVVAVLAVSDRSFQQESFDREDVRVFETVAAHAAVALVKARAVGRLRRLVAETEHAALHDGLTGLPNRDAFQRAVEEARRAGEPSAVLLLDIDDFRDVNDTLGQRAGDGLLTVTGHRLRDLAVGTVARLGADEFAVLLTDVTTDRALAAARAVQQEVTRPVPLLGIELAVSASIGVATFRGAAESAEEVLRYADVAMAAAKRSGHGLELYRPEDGRSTTRRLVLAADLPGALDREEVRLWYQPQARSSTGEVTGFEALVRWNHPTYGWVPPPDIVALAQRTGLLSTLTDRAVAAALAQQRAWAEGGHRLDVSVNVTPQDIVDDTLVQRVADALAAADAAPGSLVLEIVESDALGEPDRAVAVMRALAALGVQLSIDDFGTGYSSLAYLDRLPVHEVKIDQSFVFRLERQAGDATIVRATVALAHELGLRVVAEGVESELATRLVTELGCDLFQGFGLARPMPAEDVLGWLDRRAAHLRGVRPGPALMRSRGGGRLAAVAQPADEGPSGPLPAQLQA